MTALRLQTSVIRSGLVRRLLRLPLQVLVRSLHCSLRRFGAVVHGFDFGGGGCWVEALVGSGLSRRPILSMVRRARPIVALVDRWTVV